jgi:hypothetical protein
MLVEIMWNLDIKARLEEIVYPHAQVERWDKVAEEPPTRSQEAPLV